MIIQICGRHLKKIAGFFFLLLYGNLFFSNRALAAMNMPFIYSAAAHHAYSSIKEKKFASSAFFNKVDSLTGRAAAGSNFRTENIHFTQNTTAGINLHALPEKQDNPDIGGPSQPEMQQFQSVNGNNMVDLFSGDFSYNIPLMDVGGYPINIAYRSGISMDQEASWVGLGWNINPGTITRNMRGLPDDFNGTDSVTKITSIKTNKTVGVTGAIDLEVTGFPIGVGASLGVFHNNYKGWGLENGLNASINAGVGASGSLTGGLSLTNNTQEGLTIVPSLGIKLGQYDEEAQSGFSSSFSISAPYNSRAGLKGLQLSAGLRQFKVDENNQAHSGDGSFSSVISFVSPSFTPTITMPLSSTQYTFTAKVGGEIDIVHPSVSLTGYVSKQGIAQQDTLLALPAFGYLHYQDGARNINSALLDFNREKELIYRDKPAMPHIAVPVYTYDAFSITGEGTGGMFRAYRGDIGYVHDHFMRTKDQSGRASIDIGLGDVVHAGIDLNLTRAFTQNGAWINENSLNRVVNFKDDSADYQAVYFRNPGEKSINTKQFYDAIGGDDVVTVGLNQPSSSTILATNYLSHYKNGVLAGRSLLTPQNVVKTQRDKRTQVISYLTATEASVAGLSKYIENYTVNQFGLSSCIPVLNTNTGGAGTGLLAQYYPKQNFQGSPVIIVDTDYINHSWGSVYYTNKPDINNNNWPTPTFPKNHFSVRWLGRIKAPVTGAYTFTTWSDDGVLFWLNDSILINRNNDHPLRHDNVTVNLVANEVYDLKLEYYNSGGPGIMQLYWSYPGQDMVVIPKQYLYTPPTKDTFQVDAMLSLEQRVNTFRKPDHISEINVLNNDGRRYVYGIPIYNLKQKEATFAVNGSANGNIATGIVGYQDGTDNTAANNHNGKDNYFNSEQIPAYAHSFLLTGILSPDYVDVTGDGISDDDLGDAVKINYSKVCGIANPYKWKAPYAYDSTNNAHGLSTATFNPGLRTDSRDDKANYVYGEKELWYLHTIESKTMVATFTLEGRADLFAINEAGTKYNDGSAKRIKQIDLYSKADFLKKGTGAIPIKTVHFEYSYELCQGVNKPISDTGKLTLKKIWFTYNGNNKGKQNPYVFNYHPNNPGYNIKSYDRWGNFKDPLQNPGSSATNLLNNADYPYSLQDSSQAAYNAGAWSLDSINLPSGGAIKVDFESDDYAYVQNRRAMQMFKIIGLGPDPSMSSSSNNLYTRNGIDSWQENLYIYVKVPAAVANAAEVYQKYLTGVKKLYFKLFVKMPDDQYGTGNEYIPLYADLDPVNGYGMIDANTIWIKVSGISLAGDGPGSYSPLAKAAIQFLRLNLPSKAYPGSEVGDDIDLADAVKMIFSLADNVKNAFTSFDKTARNNSWAQSIDTSRSFIRLDNPLYKKYGGGHRVKRITIYDNWDKMIAGQRAAKYGQEYSYTTQQEINGVQTTISSGVASYEPGIGGEENPFHQPIEYVESIAPLGPTTMGYSEEPLGESFFPSAGIGYSQVRMRTINYKNIKSANGYDETKFYTAYDFPTYTERSLLDADTKKRYKPALANFLRINARYYLTMSQGFKVELNDMHGKMRSQASYPETDPVHPITYTENIYRVIDPNATNKTLANTVRVMNADGTIDTAGLIGKDAELMMDMREQLSVTNGNNISLNTDMFAMPFIPPLFLIPSLINLAQREENRYRSTATVKIIQRYGILDSVIHIDKGSKVTTSDLMYDAETGDVLLTKTKNEFNDPVYNFSYPSHWAYDGMGMAYKNIDVVLNHIFIRNGKIIQGLSVPDSTYFSSGDEILVAGKQKTGNGANACSDQIATFPDYSKIWAVDTSISGTGAKYFYFIDAAGTAFNAEDATLKIIRSGRRNMNSMVESVTTLVNPIVADTGAHPYKLVLNTASQVINAKAGEFKQVWKVEDVRRQKMDTQSNCPSGSVCYDTVIANTQVAGLTICYSPGKYPEYSSSALVYSSASDTTGNGVELEDTVSPGFWTSLGDMNKGRLNNTGIWLCDSCAGGNCTPQWTWIGFKDSIYIPVTDTFYIGAGADNQERIYVDTASQPFIELLQTDARGGYGDDLTPFENWYLFPIKLTQGYHTFTIQGFNSTYIASFGAEIYHLTRAQLFTADSATVSNNTLFSTRDIPSGGGAIHSCPIGYSLDSVLQYVGHGVPVYSYICKKPVTCPDTCHTIYSSSCYSAVTDTTLNPYVTGIWGNWRPYKNYTYYARRTESDPTTSTNIRTNGTFSDFSSFWNFSSGVLRPLYDTTRWVWNSQTTLFNKKGLEIENVDPLGRYNAGLYGYNNSLPTAVIQNGQYRESGFEGFEDYGFSTQGCDTACPSSRHFDFTSLVSKLTTTQKHSGQYSLQLNPHDQASVSFAVVSTAQDSAQAKLSFATLYDTCSHLTALTGIRVPDTVLLPAFSPFVNRKMLLGAWVKENQACNCNAYTRNEIIVLFPGSTAPSITFTPSGNIIEGWQRYEAVFTVPPDATKLTVSMQATDTATVYFDDLRIHPFNGNMKSFVYNPVNLRLMAELDENNYATFYEYDDDGTLIRVKKETERGVMTIKETRSALVKP